MGELVDAHNAPFLVKCKSAGFYDWRSCTSVWAPISATDHEIERLLSGFTLLGGLDGLLCSFLLALQRIGF
jgi:hypothetical protein